MVWGKRGITYCRRKILDGVPVRDVVQDQGTVDVGNDLTIHLLGPLDLLAGPGYVLDIEILKVELDQGNKMGNTLDVGTYGGDIGG